MGAERNAGPGRSGGLTRAELIKRGGAAAVTLSLGGVLAACGSGGGGGSRAARATTPRGTLVVAVEGDIDTFDPAFLAGSKPAQTTAQNVLDQLTRYQPATRRIGDVTFEGVDTDKVIGMLAESIDHQGDRIVFTVRSDAAFADGTPMTATLLEQSFSRLYEATPSYVLLAISGMPDKSHVRALDDRRLEFRLDTPNSLVLKEMTMINFSPIDPAEAKEHATRRDPWATEWYKANLPSATGPFALERYQPGDSIVLRARDDYYGGRPKLDRVIQKIVPDASQRLLLLKRGEVDMVHLAPVKDLDALAEDPSLKVLSFPNARSWFMQMNVRMAPLDDKQVRQAINYATPYDAIVNDVFHGYARRSRSLINEGMPGSDTSAFKYDTNLDTAAELLTAAGYPGGDGLKPFTLTVQAGAEEMERAAVLIQANLREIGMRMEIQKLPLATFNEKVQSKGLQAFIFDWLSWINDPYHHLFNIVQSESPANWSNFSDKTVDEIIARWMLSADEAGRLEATKQAQAIITEEAPFVYLASPNYNIAMRTSVQGYRYYNDELTRYAEMSKSA